LHAAARFTKPPLGRSVRCHPRGAARRAVVFAAISSWSADLSCSSSTVSWARSD